MPYFFKWVCKDLATDKRKGLRNFISNWPDHIPEKNTLLGALKSHGTKIVVQEPTWEFLPKFD